MMKCECCNKEFKELFGVLGTRRVDWVCSECWVLYPEFGRYDDLKEKVMALKHFPNSLQKLMIFKGEDFSEVF